MRSSSSAHRTARRGLPSRARLGPTRPMMAGAISVGGTQRLPWPARHCEWQPKPVVMARKLHMGTAAAMEEKAENLAPRGTRTAAEARREPQPLPERRNQPRQRLRQRASAAHRRTSEQTERRGMEKGTERGATRWTTSKHSQHTSQCSPQGQRAVKKGTEWIGAAQKAQRDTTSQEGSEGTE